MSAERDGRRVSSILTEARTVLSRAETAAERVRYLRRMGHHDPAADEILAALDVVSDWLDPFRKTGRPKRGGTR